MNSLSDKIMRMVLVVGLFSLGALMFNNVSNAAFFIHYLTVFSFFISCSIGAAFFILFMHLMRGGWGVVVRRVPEHMMSVLPFFALLFIPILFGLEYIFEWLDPALIAKDYLIQKKLPYLNLPFFILRNTIYFAIFSYVGYYYWSLSTRQDNAAPDKARQITSRLQKRSPVAILALSLATSFASFDWLMSLYSHWFSTIFGIYFFAGAMVFCLALTIIIYDAMAYFGMTDRYPTVEHFHDLSKLLYGFTIFWAYVAFSQYFLTWYANIPEFTQWYYPRLNGEWGLVFYGLIIFHFILPLFGFMSRHIKRSRLGRVSFSVLIIAVHYLDMRFIVYPNFTDSVAISGLEWMVWGAFLLILSPIMYFKIRKHDPIPLGDPRLAESKKLENAV